jgi:GntR family carbon starvation induced transcriptional regulator
MTESLANQSYDSLKEAIIRGKFNPGEKLQIEKLKAFLKVGPTPIREALSRLVTTGLVVMEANRGFFVKKVSEDEVRDVYTTFNQIELLALDRAIDLGDTAWEARILGALHQLAAIETGPSPVDFSQWLLLNYEFHFAMVSSCNSPCLLKIREDLYQQLDRFCFLSALSSKEPLSVNHQEHVKMAQAVIGRNKNMALTLMKQHMEKAKHLVIEQLRITEVFHE